jgi:hypothetical protein
MAYDKKKLEQQSLAAIEKHKLFFIQDVIAYLPCTSATFYNFELEKLETIKDALTKVKTDIKVSMRSKWYKSDAPALQIGLMKLLSTDEELRKLSMQHNNNEDFEKPIFKQLDLDVSENDSTD